MRPQLAAAICILVVVYLFRVDRKDPPTGVSRAIWVPFIWMLIVGTRYLSEWLHPEALVMSADALDNGSPLDRGVFLGLIVTGLLILSRRNLNWRELFRQNAWVWLFLLFGAISILWSEYPLVSIKRWSKALGTPIMALIVLTEENPAEALGVILRRFSFITLPVSVLFIKYYPEWGRSYFMGQPMWTGVATGKNGLGMICLICGIYYSWKLIESRPDRVRSGHRVRAPVYIVVLPLLGYLLLGSQSATSLSCMVLAICILFASRLPSLARRPRAILALVLAAVGFGAILQVTLGVSGLVINSLGRDATLTTRVPMWHDLLGLAGNPLVGVGYESFWLGSRREAIWAKYGALIQAHNGYLETYLNLGIVGLVLVAAVFLSGLSKAAKAPEGERRFAVLRLTFIIVVIVYNWTEATLYGVGNMWLLLLVCALGTSGVRSAAHVELRRPGPTTSLIDPG